MDNPRKSPRAQWIDYDGGAYFVTICTKGHFHFFGEVVLGQMTLSKIGEIVQDELKHPEEHHPEIRIPLFVVMPNHIHAIVVIESDTCHDVPVLQRNPNPSQRASVEVPRHVARLSKYIASLKSAVSRRARQIDQEFGWHSRYHDHFIRNNKDGNLIAEYILTNPARWPKDCFYNG